MFNIIDRYVKDLNISDIDKFAKSKNIFLSEEELSFTYSFLMKNYKEILANRKMFDIDRYQNKYSEENFKKIKKVYMEYLSKFGHLL